jgi:hypothetical protein
MHEESSSPFVSVLLLVLSYGLVLGAPLAWRALRAAPAAATDLAELPPWLLSVAAAGLGLAGVGLMVFIMHKVVRDLERHPYASLATALGVLLGVMLLGLHASVRVWVLDARAICFVCLVTSVLGGGLAQRGHGMTALLGITVATLPAQVVCVSVWSQHGFPSDVVSVWLELSQADQAFLAVLTVSGVLLSLIGVVSRSLMSPALPAQTSEAARTSIPAAQKGALAQDGPQAGEAQVRDRLAHAMSLALADLQGSELPPPKHVSLWNFEQTAVETGPAQARPRTYDEEIFLPRKPNFMLLGSLLALLGAGFTIAWVLLRR